MNEIRKKRLEAAIIKEVSSLIHKKRVKDERLGLVSVTRAHLAPDLSYLTVYVSPFGSDEENRQTLRALEIHIRFFQSTLSRNLRLRQTPHLTFERDDTIREGDRIIDLLES